MTQHDISRNHIITVADFWDAADALRLEFDERMGDVRCVTKGRFVWDYWHVSNQYTYLRTPSRDYFSRDLLRGFLNRLRHWGEDTLGCTAVSNPWLSYYVEGCFQSLHTDVPHGPWAYVYSLTHWEERVFRGGETLLAKPECLNYWHHFSPDQSIEQGSLLQRVSPDFNRLVVFDPRIPHGVEQVRGNLDPLRSRVVLHGWFKPPEVMVKGVGDCRKVLGDIRHRLESRSNNTRVSAEISGLLVCRLDISASGVVISSHTLTDNLVHRYADMARVAEARESAINEINHWRFEGAAGPLTAHVPISFPPGLS